MVFDSQKLLKSSSLNPRQKLNAAVNKAASNMSSKLSSAVTEKLASAGQSLKSATSFAAAKTDALLSSAPEAFTSMAALGKGSPSVERISRQFLKESKSGKGNKKASPQETINPNGSNNLEIVSYPEEIADLEYKMTLEFMEYKRPSVSSPPSTETRFTINLPIPNTLIEGYGVGFSEGEYGATIGNIINVVDDQIGSNPTEVDVSAEGIAGMVPAISGAARGALQSSSGRPGGVSGIIDQTLGSIVNPHLALFFTGVSLREHQFFWPFAPRNSADSAKLKEIYYRIKRAVLPAFTEDAFFTTLEYPMMVKVRIITKGKQDLYPFKMCMISGINMNYATSGTPAFHIDGRPALQQLSITLKEMEYFTSNNFVEAEYSDIENQFRQTGITASISDSIADVLQGDFSPITNGISGAGDVISNNPNVQNISQFFGLGPLANTGS
jgi:hypothetical protein